MISKDKQYQTVEGHDVRIYAVDGGGMWPVHGAIKKEDTWYLHYWQTTGKHVEYTHLNLVEVPKTQKAWINIYDHEPLHMVAHKTKEEANKAANPKRLACVQIEFKEGQGLERGDGL